MIAALLLAANVAVASGAPLAHWTGAPGRKCVEYLAPGAILRGYSYVGKVERGPVLLLFGGENQNIETLDTAARGFARNASRVVVYDYRGSGFSTGVANWDDFRADAVKLYDATLAGSSVKRVVVLGCCYAGTGIADMQWAQVIHGVIGVLFIAAIFAHIYIGTLGMEGAFEAMGEGEVDLNWAKEHHRLWVEQEIANGRAADVTPRGAAATPAE